MRHTINIKLDLKGNESDLHFKFDIYNDSFYPNVSTDMILYNPNIKTDTPTIIVRTKLINNFDFSSDEVTKLLNLSNWSYLTDDDVIAYLPYSTIMDYTDKFQHIIRNSLINDPKISEIPNEILNVVSEELPKECNYKTFKSLTKKEQNLYTLHYPKTNNYSLNNCYSKEVHRERIQNIYTLLDILSNHSDRISNITTSITLGWDYNTLSLETTTIDNKIKLTVNENIIYNGNRYDCNCIDIKDLREEFEIMFKDIDTSKYMNTIIDLKSAKEIIDQTCYTKYIHQIDPDELNNCLKSIAKTCLNESYPDHKKLSHILSSHDAKLCLIEQNIVSKKQSINHYKLIDSKHIKTTDCLNKLMCNKPKTLISDDTLILLKAIIYYLANIDDLQKKSPLYEDRHK